MAKKAKRKTHVNIPNASLLLIGLVFVIESVALMAVLSGMGTLITRTAITIGWAYALLKLFAGFVAMYAAAKRK